MAISAQEIEERIQAAQAAVGAEAGIQLKVPEPGLEPPAQQEKKPVPPPPPTSTSST